MRKLLLTLVGAAAGVALSMPIHADSGTLLAGGGVGTAE
jgi:hypothetical protein